MTRRRVQAGSRRDLGKPGREAAMMFNRLDQAKSLTINQLKIIAAAIIGDMLEFFD